MNELQTTGYLHKLFQDHGVPSVIENDWVVPNSELPALRALSYPGESNGRLDVQALVRDKVVIEECFAGVGQGVSGMHNALANFTLNSFHVLLAALWGKNDPEQVTTENWVVGGRRYIAYIGNFGTRSSEGVTAHIPHGLFAEVEAAIKRGLSPKTSIGFAYSSATSQTSSPLRRSKTTSLGRQVNSASKPQHGSRAVGITVFAFLRCCAPTPNPSTRGRRKGATTLRRLSCQTSWRRREALAKERATYICGSNLQTAPHSVATQSSSGKRPLRLRSLRAPDPTSARTNRSSAPGCLSHNA